MPRSYKIYALIDPRNRRFYYVGKTERALQERLDEHFFDIRETQVSKKTQAIKQSGLDPQPVLLEEVRDTETLFRRELYWIFMLKTLGHPLTNREASKWYVREYDNIMAPPQKKSSATSSRRTSSPKPTKRYTRRSRKPS